MAISNGIPMPKAAKIIWKASDMAICERAKKKSLIWPLSSGVRPDSRGHQELLEMIRHGPPLSLAVADRDGIILAFPALGLFPEDAELDHRTVRHGLGREICKPD